MSAKRGWLLRQIQYNSISSNVSSLCVMGEGRAGEAICIFQWVEAGRYRPSQHGAGCFSGDLWGFSLLKEI